ncbi:hypothetical protein FNH22_22890 [Fulvivirga sp. M361]|uniref:hypothetical protein n=1 Tax=Fulvivirga sp. M361 TaxID=2594266 RepID=UPI001179F570|nr:hypothetical protein [Fulvivirga sp. M361]TRX52022.1 hypothetical protein FNH22_22890 [Fulvivirga sp. M361]
MPDVIKGFTHTEYLIVFIAIIFGYVGAEYFMGWGSMLRNRAMIKRYWQHLLWTIFAFLVFMQNWWGIWPRTAMLNESIYYFLYSLIPIFLFHLLSVILFPDFKSHQKVDMKEHFYKNARWFFTLLASYFITTIISSFVYTDVGNVFMQNLIRGAGVILSLAAAYWNNTRLLHYILLIIGYISLAGFFLALPS